MQRNKHKGALAALVPVIVGAGLGCAVLFHQFAYKRTDFNATALGIATQAVYEQFDGDDVHCSGEPSIKNCLASAQARPVKHRDMLMGASQLYAVNEYRTGDHAAPWLLTQAMRARGRDLFALSMPNANFQEMLVLFQEARHQARIDGLVLATLYDDMREQGVREAVRSALHSPAGREALRASEIGRSILGDNTLSSADMGAAAYAANSAAKAGDEQSLQTTTEAFLTGGLEKCCELWALRSEARGQFAIWSRKLVHLASMVRNRYSRDLSQFRIPVPRADYQRNRAALEAILADAKKAGIPTLLYIVPRPTDFFPYDPDEYAAFKEDMSVLAGQYGARVVNIENTVPNELWGLTDITVGYPIRDHFHFTGDGHRIMAKAIEEKIVEFMP